MNIAPKLQGAFSRVPADSRIASPSVIVLPVAFPSIQSTAGINLAIGDGAVAGSLTTVGSIAIGNASIPGTGFGARAIGQSCIAIGNASSGGSGASAINCIAIGNNANAGSSNTGSIAIGASTSGNNNYTTTVGNSASSGGQWSTAIGANTSSGGSYSTAIGYGATAANAASIAIGKNVTSVGVSSTVIGDSAYGNGSSTETISIGDNANTGSSGSYSIGIGGYSTTNANYSIALGYSASVSAAGAIIIASSGGISTSSNNQASSIYLGFGGKTDFVSEFAFSATQFATGGQGSVKCSTSLLLTQTTDATVTELGLGIATANNTPTNRIILTNDSSYIMECDVVARDTLTDSQGAAWKLQCLIVRGAAAANTALIGSVTKTIIAKSTNASNNSWDVTITADTTNGRPNISVTGESGSTIRWVANLKLTKVTG